MNQTLKALLSKYGIEAVIARILEQLKLMAFSKDEEVKMVVKDLLQSSGCDTEYIYSLCEYTNLATYISEEDEVTDDSWNDEGAKSEISRLMLIK